MMHKKEHNLALLMPLLSLLLFPGCITSKEQMQSKHDRYDTFLQIAIPNHEGIQHIRKVVVPKIDAIIQQELRVPDGVEFPRFHIPSWQQETSRLTLYYLHDLKKGDEQIITDALDVMPYGEIDVLSIAEPLGFFGDNEQYVVFSIADPHESLHKLNREISASMRFANDQDKKERGYDVYDVAKSERFPFVPHIALGRLQPDYFYYFIEGLPAEKQFMGGSQEEKNAITQRIKERIRKEIFPVINQLLKTVSTALSINSFCMYKEAVDKKMWRTCLKEYPLKRKT